MNSLRLGDVCRLNYGKALSGYSNEPSESNEVRVFGTNGAIGWTKDSLFDGASIIVGRKGAYRGVHFSHESAWVIDTAYYLSLSRNDVDLKWLYYKLLTYDINRLDSGSAIPSTKREDFYSLGINFPSLETQKKSAAQLTDIDDLIENNRRRIALLEQSAQLLYREWFVYLRFPGHEHVKIVDGVPDGWDRGPLGDLLTLQRGFDLPAAERIEGDFPIYAATGINGYHNKAMVTGPGVITGRSGSLGTVRYSPTDFWPLNTALWVKEFKRVSPEFAHFLLGSLNLEQYNGGVAVPTLNRNDVHRIEVSLPPKTLLDEFTDVVLVQLRQIDNLTQYNNKLREARNLLLPRLMHGEMV